MSFSLNRIHNYTLDTCNSAKAPRLFCFYFFTSPNYPSICSSVWSSIWENWLVNEWVAWRHCWLDLVDTGGGDDLIKYVLVPTRVLQTWYNFKLKFVNKHFQSFYAWWRFKRRSFGVLQIALTLYEGCTKNCKISSEKNDRIFCIFTSLFVDELSLRRCVFNLTIN